ncbi:MAG: hypothetical protein HKN48_10610, partial [Flavobacteriaceae bacterium]|nr:hypothetical protein [Flavobacteriaceae bacterium]
MKFKKLLFVFAIFVCGNLIAQETFGPSTVISGTFKGKTIPLRDFPVITPDESKPNVMKIISNNLRANEKLDPTGLPLGADPLRQADVGGIASYALEENFD